MRSIKILVVLILSISSFMGSCTIEGPEGEQGVQGERGDTGPKGETGTVGEDGESEGFDSITESEWNTYSFEGTDRKWEAIISDNDITQTIIDKADVIIYLKEPDGAVRELNYFSDANNITQSLSIGQIKLASTFDASEYSFRYVIIIGGTQAAIAKWKISRGLD